MEKIKIIFLDVDGVLNPESNMHYHYNNNMSTSSYYIKLQENCLLNLKNLVDYSNAKIVVSSSWRIGGYQNQAILNLSGQLEEYNLTIYGFTPILGTERGVEIREFIKRSPRPIESFVILDDDRDMCEFTNSNLVLCPYKTGFGTKELEMAKRILDKSSIQVYNRLRRRYNEKVINNAK